jgi:hypothetical protein
MSDYGNHGNHDNSNNNKQNARETTTMNGNYDDILAGAEAKTGGGDKAFSKEEYAAKKRAERDAVYTLADNTALEAAGNGETFKGFLDVQGKFDRYSAVNALLILAQKPEATKLGDFDYWKSRGGYVKPGEKAIDIIEPGNEYTREDGTTAVSYNVKKVFDLSQVDMRKAKPAPAPAWRDERALLRALVEKAPVKILSVDELRDGGGAATNPETGDISVRKGLAFPDLFRSLAHELAYAAVPSESRIDPRFAAYAASYALCKKYGVDTQNFNFGSAPPQFRDMDAQTVKRELSGIKDAIETVSTRMARNLDAKERAAKNADAR